MPDVRRQVRPEMKYDRLMATIRIANEIRGSYERLEVSDPYLARVIETINHRYWWSHASIPRA